MRTPSLAHWVGVARGVLLGSLFWLATSVGAQETTPPAPVNTSAGAGAPRKATLLPPVDIGPEETPLTQVAAFQVSSPASAGPAAPPAKGDNLKELLELPLEKLAEQPVRVPLPSGAEVAAVAAAAAAASSAVNPFVPGPVVSAASRREEKVAAAPAGVVVIDRSDIVLRGYSTLVDVLRDLPGMETIEDFHEWGTQVPVRGIVGNNKFVILVNGMRVNPPGGENFPLFNDFSVRFAERIEVVYGSGTVLYGQDAISMIINIVTKKPGEGPSAGESPAAAGADQLATGSGSGSLPGSTKLTAQVGADGGVHLQRDTWGWFGGVLDPEHQVTYTGYVQYHDSNLTPINKAYPAYWADYITRENAPNRFNSNGVVPHLDDYGINFFGRVEGYNSSIQYWHREAQRNSAEGFSPALAFVPEAIWRDESDVLEGTNTLHLTKNVSLESRLTYNRYEVDPVSRYVEPDPTNPNAWFLNDYKYAIGWQGREEETLRIDLPDRITLLTGVVVSYSDVIPKSTVPGGFNPAGLSPVEQGGTLEYLDSLGMPHLIPRVTETKYWDYSPYVEAQWQLLDRLRLIGGTRITWDDRFQVVPITPRAAVVYNLTDQITAKYVYTEGFVAPAPYFANAVYDRLDILAQPNPSVGPESSKEHDVILTYARNNFSLTLNPYYGTQSGIVIVSDQDTPLNIVDMPPSIVNGMVTVPPGSLSGPPGPRTLVQTVNGGTSKRYGADIYGKGNFGSFSPWFSYSYVDYRQITAGVTTGLPGISRHNGRLGVTWTATPRLFITPSLEIRSTPENVDPGLLGEELKTPYTINLFVLYKYSQNLELFLSLHNLTNHHYALGGITPLQSGGLPLAIPQETFNGVLGLQLRY